MNSKKSVFDTLTEMVISAEGKLSTILAEREKCFVGFDSPSEARAWTALRVLRNELRSVSSLARLARMIERQTSGRTKSTDISIVTLDRIEESALANAPNTATPASTTERPESPTSGSGSDGCASSADRPSPALRRISISGFPPPTILSQVMKDAVRKVAEDAERRILHGDPPPEETCELDEEDDGRSYYGGWEVMEFIESLDLDRGFALGNAIKYIARAGEKDPATEFDDLRKAVDYLNRYIEINETDEFGEDDGSEL